MRIIFLIITTSLFTACTSGKVIDYTHPTNSDKQTANDASTCKAEGHKIAGPRPEYSEERTKAAKLEHKEALRAWHEAYLSGFIPCMDKRGYDVTVTH